MIKFIKVIILKKSIIILGIFLLILCGCSKKDNPIVSMEFQDYGTIEIELYPDIAPNTVANFVNLIEDGFYDNNSIHRVVPGFVIQGGDPNGDGTGGPGYSIKGEFKENNYQNSLSHTRGVISMARSSDPDSAGSQFFIVLDDSAKTSLDGKYAAFGKVTKGMDIIDKMVNDANIKDKTTGKLKENHFLSKVTVNTFGETYTVKKEAKI